MGITEIDWSNAGFIRTYTMAFGASVVLTVVLWLVAVAKRAIQGVSPVQALGESIGYLLLSVMTSAFAPLGIAYLTQVFDGLAEAMLAPVTQDLPKIGAVLGGMLAVLLVIPGGPVIVLSIGFFLLMAILGVWLELIVRNALIYTGLVFGPTVFAGLVDKDLWGHTKRWLGVIVGIIASKYVTFTALALASALLAGQRSEGASTGQAFGTILTAVALFFLALYLPFQVAKFIPILGDQVQDVFSSRKQMEGGLSNVAQSAKSSFGDIKSKLGGGSEGDDVESGDGGDEIDAAAAGGEGAAPGIGLAKAAQERGEQEVEAAAMRGVDGATAASEPGDDQGDGTGSAGGAGGTPEQAADPDADTGTDKPAQGADDSAQPGVADTANGTDDPAQPGTANMAQSADDPAQPGTADMANGADPHQGAAADAAPADGGPGSGSPAMDGPTAAGGAAPVSGGHDGTEVASAESGPSGSVPASSAGAPAESFSDGSPVEEPPDDGE
ncbi:hypothetical protein ABT263_35825 [Kitasatospora sp. NPDC001603]|uniref:hypothetical protein n=1 Tax=Kitasatospora sp. NPDC001603 TaxID=3154388 RepID=UPI0033333E02